MDALKFLKSKSILHRDVKPSNILINQNPVIFKLCDFGICSPLVDSVSPTNTKGTQIYLAVCWKEFSLMNKSCFAFVIE